MVSYTVLALVAAGTLLVGCVVAAGFVWVANTVRALRSASSSHNLTIPQGDAPSDVDISSLRMLSQRLAVLEGSVQPMQQVLDGYAALATRVAGIESALPAVIDAYDKFSQTTLNAEKRRDTRDRNSKKKGDDEDGVSVEQAAAQMGMAGNPEPAPVETASNGKRAGVLGRGGK